MMKKSKKRIHGNDRGLMMLCRDVRRRWLQYGENRKLSMELCAICQQEPATDVDHIIAVGSRPRTFETLGPYVKKMFTTKCQALCRKCHTEKTKRDRS